MKKAIRIILPIVLVLAILICLGWYLFIYDREFTRDALLFGARYFEAKGNHTVASWFYDRAYTQAGDNDAVAIELAMQHKASGNYTKAEFTLTNAIADGGSADLYVALCQLFVEQDKLMDAVKLLDALSAENSTVDPQIRTQLDEMRPKAPTATPEPGFYSQYISVSVEAEKGTLYVNPNAEYPSVKDAPYSEPVPLHDGENTIYALALDENGLVSPLSIFGYTVGGVIEEVSFTDKAVEAQVRALLGVSEDTTLMSNELWQITSFTMPAEAVSFADLKYMSFLEDLTISGCASGQLSNLSALSNLVTLTVSDTAVLADELPIIGKLPKLEQLTLSGCGLSTLAGLENAKNLTAIDLSNNTVRNISPLAQIEKLQTVYLQHNVVEDLTSLASSKALTKLDVSYNSLTNVAPISTLPTLTWLNISNNSITALSGIEKLVSLTYLSAGYNTLTDVAPLASCTALTELDISNNTITDIATLSTLTKLTKLNFSHNQVSALPAWPTDCALVVIDGSHNQLTSLEKLAGLSYLNNVYMDYNEAISSVNVLSSCPVLIQVNVYGTKVTEASDLTSQSIVVNFDPTKN